MVRQWQEMFFEERYSYVAMENPSFTTIADAYGIKNVCVNDRSTLGDSIEQLLSAEEPYLLDIHVKKEEKVFPMITSGEAVDDIRLE
jgi:acetolactate synthase-1/2/3 large subunit